MGPRQIIGLSSGTSRPIEISFSPYATTGWMRRSFSTSGVSFAFSITGTLGP